MMLHNPLIDWFLILQIMELNLSLLALLLLLLKLVIFLYIVLHLLYLGTCLGCELVVFDIFLLLSLL